MRRVDLHLDLPTARALEAWCRQNDRPLSWAARRAVQEWLSRQSVLVGDLGDWKPDRPGGSFGDTQVSYLRSAHSTEGGHQIAHRGRIMWVLPDGHSSGLRRSREITAALGACDMTADPEMDPLAYLWGALTLAQLGTLVWRAG